MKASGQRSGLFMTLSFLSSLLVLFTYECHGATCEAKNKTDFIACSYAETPNSDSYVCESTIQTTNSASMTTTKSIAKSPIAAADVKNITNGTDLDDTTENLLEHIPDIIHSTDARQREEKIDLYLNHFADEVNALEKAMNEEKQPHKKREKATNLLNVILTVVESVFSTNMASAIEKSEPQKRNKIVGKLFSVIETRGPLIASTLLPGETETTSKGHVEMLLANVDVYALGRDAGFTVASNSFSFKKTSLVKLSAGQNTLGLSSALFTGAVNLLTPHDAANGTIPLMKPTGIIGYSRMNTHILMISLNMKKRNGDILLSENVTITMELQTQGLSSPVCYSMHPLTAELTSEGCTAQPINATHAACSCNHLTSFAILMSVTKSAEEPDLVLDIVSYVSCSLSILFFLLSFITFVSFDALKSDPSTIHANLVVCLGFGQLLFLLGIDRTQNKVRLKLRVHVGGVTAKIGNKENRNA